MRLWIDYWGGESARVGVRSHVNNTVAAHSFSLAWDADALTHWDASRIVFDLGGALLLVDLTAAGIRRWRRF